jgi:hypothetical protein
MSKNKLLAPLFFFLFILLSLGQAIHPIIQINPIDEKRELAKLPHGNIITNIREDRAFPQKLENFVSDHFPIRDALIRVQNEVYYRAFNHAKEVIIGRDGWLSDKEVLNNQLPQLNKISDSDIEYSIKQIKKLQEYLDKNGTKLLIVVVPMKATVYSDRFQGISQTLPTPSGLDKFQLALGKNDISYLDLKSEFLEIRNISQLYYKTDVHWSTLGAAVAAERIVQYLSDLYGVTSPWQGNLQMSEEEFVGSDSKSIPMLSEISERVPVLSVPKTFNKSFFDYTYPSPVLRHVGTNKGLAKLPQMIMFGNSFMLSYPSVGFHDYFSTSTRVLDYQFFSKVLDYIRPSDRIFIWNIYETQLLFHVLPPDNFNYWDKRIFKLPLPTGYKYIK